MICYWNTYGDPNSCYNKPTKDQFDAFQALLDKADKEKTHKIDDNYLSDGDYHEVDKDFYACPTHVKELICCDCKHLLTRHQIHNFLNSDDYNHNGDRFRNFGVKTDACCTGCCIENDYDLRCNVGLEDDSLSSDEESVSSKGSSPKASRNTMIAAEIPLPPSPKPANAYNEFFVQQHPSIKAANPSWTPQQITTEIGRRWSLQQMSISQTGDQITITHAKTKYKLDGCGKGTELRLYLEAYRAKNGDESFLKLVEKLSN